MVLNKRRKEVNKMNENTNIVTIKGETFYKVGHILHPTPETEQGREAQIP